MPRRPVVSLEPLRRLTRVRIPRLFLLLGILTPLVLYAVFRSGRFQELMRRKAERVLTQAVGRPVRIGGFDLALVPPRFVVKDVWLANDPRGLAAPAFSAAEIELRGIPRVSERRVDLPKVRVIEPRILLEAFADGSTNFSTLFASLPRSKGDGVDVRLREAVLQRGSVRFREWRTPLDVAVSGVAVTARSGRSSKVTGLSFLCREARLALKGYEPFAFGLAVDAVLSPGRVHASRIAVDGGGIRLRASGGVDDLSRPELTLSASTTFTAEALDRHFGTGLPIDGAVDANAVFRLPPGGSWGVRGTFRVEDGTLGPFPVSGAGTLRIDPEGVLVEAGPLSILGGTAETTVRVGRLKGPPLPVRIVASGRDLDFERFFTQIGLPGTGLMARGDVSAELAFEEGGIEAADGSAELRLSADASRPSAVKGRHAIPLGGGGTLLIRDGRIVFQKTPLLTGGRTSVGVDGTLAIGSWEPDLGFSIDAADLHDVERVAENLYYAILGKPLAPPMRLSGSGRLTARLTRSFADPHVEGHLEGRELHLRQTRFGDVASDFVVDRDVLTLDPFSALDGGRRLTATGRFGFGAELGDHYSLDGFALDVEEWPLERILGFLDLDLPLRGAVTGRLPLDGLTPALRGSARLSFRDGAAWGQPLATLAGVFSFEGDRLRLSDASGTIASGCVRGEGEYAYDERYRFAVDVDDVPVSDVPAVADRLPALAGAVSGRFSGEGSLSEPRLVARLAARGLRYEGRSLGPPGAVATLEADVDGWRVDASAKVPSTGTLSVASRRKGPGPRDVETRLDLRLESLKMAADAIGLPDDVALDGAARVTASVVEGPGGSVGLTGELAPARFTLNGRPFLSERGAFRYLGGSLELERLEVQSEETVGLAGAERPVTKLALWGAVGLTDDQPLRLRAEGVFDASVLRAALGAQSVSGPVAVDLEAVGSVDVPRLSGRLALEGVDYLAEGGTTPVEGIRGLVLLSPGRVQLSGISFRFDGGVDLAGTIALDGWKPTSIRLNAHLDRLRSQPFPGFRCVVTGDLILLGDVELRTARGDLTMESGIYTQDVNLDLSAILDAFGGAPGGGAPAASSFDAVALDVRIASPSGAVEVRNNVARLRATAELFARGTWGRPLLFGQVEAEDGGRLTLRGQRYEVLGAKVLFSNPERIEPFFDLSARTNLRDYQVTVGLTGTPARLAPRFSADPPLSEAQIVSLLLTGELEESTATGIAPGQSPVSSDQSIAMAARQFLASLATGAAAERTRELFGLDRLQIDPVFSGSTFQAARLTIGKTISKDLTVTYSYTASSNQEQIIQIDYQISPSVFLQFRRDETGVYSADLKVRQRLR